MAVKTTSQIDVPNLLSLMKNLVGPTVLGKTLRIRRDVVFRLAADQALRSLESDSEQSTYVLPIGIHLNTTNKQVIKEANAFWLRALAQEGFAVIAEREVPGSWYKVFLAGSHDKNAPHQGPSKLKKHAVRFLKKFKNVVEVILIGGAFMNPTPPAQPPKLPIPIEQVLPKQEAKTGWEDTFKQLEEVAEKGDKVIGGTLAIFELAKRKKKNGDKEESEDSNE